MISLKTTPPGPTAMLCTPLLLLLYIQLLQNHPIISIDLYSKFKLYSKIWTYKVNRTGDSTDPCEALILHLTV